MQSQYEMNTNARDNFEGLQLDSTCHVESHSSATVENILENRRESKRHRHSMSACEPLDADDELAILISFFANQEPKHATLNVKAEPLSAKAQTKAFRRLRSDSSEPAKKHW